jgi:hypothetical protein
MKRAPGWWNTPEALTHQLDSGERQAVMKTRPPCVVEHCERASYSRGMCNSHYVKWSKGTQDGALPSIAERKAAALAAGEWACRVCKVVKPAAAYGKAGGWACMTCQCDYQRERYARGGALSRQKSRESAARHRPARSAMVNAIKLERGCLDCGYNADPAALHFDHRVPAEKLFTVAKAMSYSLPKLMAEIAKCDVRCANCHAIRSVREGHVGGPRMRDEPNEDAA